MNIEILNAFDESTLKQMVINLMKQNQKLKDNEETKELEMENKIREFGSEKNKLETEIYDITIVKDKYKKLYQDKLTFIANHIYCWIEQNLLEENNIMGKDGMERAPTDFETLYNDYVEWCQEEEIFGRADKKMIKHQLKNWQEKSKYGLSFSTKKENSECYPNGYEKAMKFNLIIV